MTLPRRLLAEGAGTAALLAIVVGSGIMGERLAGGNAAVALLANSLATGCGLFVLILASGPVSGAQFNPAVTAVAASRGEMPWRTALWCIVIQIAGGVVGVVIAHGMFDTELLQVSMKVRSGAGQWLAESVATFGLVTVIIACQRYDVRTVALAVSAYVTAAYWFTASTSFANPAATLARSMTNTFAGIRPIDVPMFIAAEVAGAALALASSIFYDRAGVK